MKRILLLLAGAVVLTGGCKTADVSSATGSSVLGKPVQSVVDAHSDHRIRVFDPEGKELGDIPDNQRGDVSIYNKEMTAQDNYAFDENGVIYKHQRSYGEDYGNAVWKVVGDRKP